MPENSSRVPLVRCPKCGNLLPELPPYSVYCCGACGAFLRAEKGSSVDDVLSENSFERAGEGSERVINSEITGMPEAPARISKSVRSRYGGAIRKSPIGESNLGDSDAQSRSSGRSMDGDARKPPLTESRSGDLDGRGKSPARSVRQGFRNSPMKDTVMGELDERRSIGSDVVANYEEMEAREKVGAWFDHVKEDTGYANRLDAEKDSFNEFDYESEVHRPRVSPMGFGSIPRGEQVRRRADQIVDEIEYEYDDPYAMRRVEVPHDHGVPRGHREMRVQDGYVGGFRGNNSTSSVQQRFPVYPNGGPSNYPSYYGYDQPSSRHSQESYIGSSTSLQNVEMNRAELLSLYNDLQEQLTIAGDLPGNPVRRGHYRISSADVYGGPDDYVHDEPLRLRRPAASVDLDERARMNPHYIDRSRGPVLQSRFAQNEFPFADDPSWPQIPGRTQHRRHYPQRSYQEYIPGHSVDSTYEQAPAAFGYRRYPDSPIHTASDFPDPHVQRASGPRFTHSTPHGVSSHSRSSVESKSDEGGSVKEHKKRVLVANQSQLLCHPIAGAAPFVMCNNCSQLLRLPKKLITMKKTRLRLQCGSCHTAFSFDFNRKKSNASTQLQPKPYSTVVYDEPSKASESDQKSTHESSAGITNRESYDFDENGYTFPSTDSEPSMQLPNPKEAEAKQVLNPSSSNASRDGLGLGNAVSKIDAYSPLMSNKPLRPPPGSTLQEHFDYSAMFSIKRSDEIETDDPDHDDKVITDRDSSSLHYLQNKDVQAELEINSNEVPKLDVSRSAADASRKQGESSFASNSGRASKFEIPKLGMSRSSADISSKRGESFFASISGRSSNDLSPSHDVLNAKINVFVNGNPLAHRLVRKAEKMAGPISPGNYWYDARAGFWGIMGGCCLGIIPPFIEEFGFPIPVDCAGGNTGICVNGRELHEKDLELLASRGFPRTSNKSYVIDISGKVEDEETGDVVGSLGKLAPTVEKTKRGFGMQPPEMQEE